MLARAVVRTFVLTLCASSVLSLVSRATHAADDTPAAFSTLKVPEGFTVEVAAAPPLIERPIVAAFDDEGRLYVAESSGSNDPVEKQLAEKPHRIVRLEDTDGDGKFDRRIVFAEHMMFPEGAMFFDGSLYVAAAPSIWKLTDKDGDGTADERVEWYQGKTLTGCANDLHGPYAGPDGWIYWCKGAFAEQTHVVNGREWKTKAAHIFRCRPDGTGFEPVLTGGMDNPVDVAFMPDGERILSGTFFAVDPRQDGLIHAIYGGVYGKDHGVLAGHPRTGELMPILDPLSAAAGSGLERYNGDAFGPDYRDNLFLCQFNLRKVSRHILKPAGATYTTEDSDFVSSDFVDFHPTDVLADADGSLLVIDTGGWYKLCCPTSQLWKPDVLGGIYRVRRTGGTPTPDARGRQINWNNRSAQQLWNDLADVRPALRQRATRELVRRRNSDEVTKLLDGLATNSSTGTTASLNGNNVAAGDSPAAAISRAWALVQLNTKPGQQLLRQSLDSDVEELRHIALYAASLNRDATATADVVHPLQSDTPANRRIAAEALGRIGDRSVVPQLLAAASSVDDRLLQHSIIYALIELGDADATRKGLVATDPKTIAAALIALDQMPGGHLQPKDVISQVDAADSTLHDAALWVVRQHPDWGIELTGWLRTQLRSLPVESDRAAADRFTTAVPSRLSALLDVFRETPAVQALLAEAAASNDSPPHVRALALQLMASAKPHDAPANWADTDAEIIGSADAALLPLALAAARSLPVDASAQGKLRSALAEVAGSSHNAADIRVQALAIIARHLPSLNDDEFALLSHALSGDNTVAMRSNASDALSSAPLSPQQLTQLCAVIRAAGPVELNRLLTPFAQTNDRSVGLRLLAAIKENPSVGAVRLDLLRESLAKYDASVQAGIAELEAMINVDAAEQRKRVEELLPLVAKGDIRRGHAVFYSAKAVCSTCHRLGYAGGTIGPDLSHVGQTRTERDLLESILFPSLSFVRSYEPVLIIMQDGKTTNGVIKDETAQDYVVATGPDQLVRISKADVDEIQPSKTSIMPAGLDKQLTTQELVDLVTFLKNSTNH